MAEWRARHPFPEVAALLFTLFEIAKLSGVDPHAYFLGPANPHFSPMIYCDTRYAVPCCAFRNSPSSSPR